jgi:hypothetical protein
MVWNKESLLLPFFNVRLDWLISLEGSGKIKWFRMGNYVDVLGENKEKYIKSLWYAVQDLGCDDLCTIPQRCPPGNSIG